MPATRFSKPTRTIADLDESATWIGGTFISPVKVSKDDTMLPEVVFWFDTTRGEVMTCEVAKPSSAYRCLMDTLGDHLMTYHRSHGRFPDTIQVVEEFCAGEIQKIVPLSIAVEVRPVDELNRCVQKFLQTLQAREKAHSHNY